MFQSGSLSLRYFTKVVVRLSTTPLCGFQPPTVVNVTAMSTYEIALLHQLRNKQIHLADVIVETFY